MNQEKQWLAVAATKQPSGEMKRSVHIVYGSPIVIAPNVRLVEDEDGVRPGLQRPLNSPDVMLLVAPGVDRNAVLEEAIELASDLFLHDRRAERTGRKPALRQLTEQNEVCRPGHPCPLESCLQQDIIEAGAEWLKTGVEPAPTCEPIWVGEGER